MFTCLYLATKIDEIQLSIEVFVRAINEEKYCNIDSKISIKLNLYLLELTVNEVFLVKSLKFQLIVYTPYHILDYMVDKLCPTYV